MQKTLIDRFSLGYPAKEEFFQRVRVNRNLISTIPGFIGDFAYIRYEANRIHFVTVATWKNEEAIQNAKKRVFAEYEKEGFDMPGFLSRLGITIEREIYEEMPSNLSL